MIDVVDLLIIGSGISGLSAALEAKKYFKNVLILIKDIIREEEFVQKKSIVFVSITVLLTLIKVVKGLI